MQPSPFGLPATWRQALESLAARPVVLAWPLLAVNALTQPYLGLFHDARLYAAQITERVEPGTLSLDLYLRYGSQDSYSIFSALLAPLVRLAGLEPAFFLAYLLSKALFFVALARLVPRLLAGEPLAAVLSLLFVAMAPLPFGGNEVFRLNESFLTPRIAACALSLFAVERALAGRRLQAAGLVAVGLLIHPLMAFGAGLVLVLWGLFARLPLRALLVGGAVVALAGAAVVFSPLGGRLFGRIDEEWQTILMYPCFFIDPATWTAGDWARIALAAAAAAAAARWSVAPAPLLAALVIAGVMGIAGNAIGVRCGHLLLLQTSPYRALWLLELFAAPLAVALAARLWLRPGLWGPPAGLLVLGLVTADWNPLLAPPWLVLAAIWPICVVWQRGLSRVPHREDWPAAAAAAALAVGAVLLLAFDASIYAILLTRAPTFETDLHPVSVAQAACGVLYKLPLAAAVAAGLAARVARRGAGPRLAATLAASALLFQCAVASLDASDAYNARYSARKPHVRYVSDFLRERGESLGRTPTVYWTTDLGEVWFRGRSRCYFNSVQLSGCAFNRGTAVEGWRRSRLVRNFEVASLRRAPLLPWWERALAAFYDAPTAGPPTEGDLLALCAEEAVDFVIVTERFGDLHCATDGVLYVYDCASLRRSAGARAGARRIEGGAR